MNAEVSIDSQFRPYTTALVEEASSRSKRTDWLVDLDKWPFICNM
jgi:hypothetical protein